MLIKQLGHARTLFDVGKSIIEMAAAPAVDKIKMTVTNHFLWRQ
ncbi:MAG: hypothetical protein WAS05_00850 [Candidatus Nanopelagicales bacterium]